MKKIFSISSSLCLILTLFGTQATVSSCKKTVYVHDTTRTTITVTDTVAPVVPTNTQLLAKYTWEIGELYQIVPGTGGDTTHYLRGVSNTTATNWDPVRYTFKADGTGTNTGSDNVSHNLTWKFISADESSMQLTLDLPGGSQTFIWTLVSISDEAILQTTAQTNFLVTSKLIPVK
jgi:hypothetical protein